MMSLIQYLICDKTKNADNKTANTATFINCSVAHAPTGLPNTGVNNFTFYVNGQNLVIGIISFVQVGNDLVLTIDNEIVGYEFNQSDEVTAYGKFN